MALLPQEEYLPHISYDSVIFGFSGKRLEILIMEYHNKEWFGLPGGFLKKEENLDDAVKNSIIDRTGLENIYLEQFHTFGNYGRFDAFQMRKMLIAAGEEFDESYWMLDRFISVAYYALIDYFNVSPQPDHLSESINWYPLDELPPLIYDHEKIVQKALETLKANLNRKIVGLNLLPKKFTMKELQMVFEAILGEPIQRTNFQRKMLSMGILKRHEKRFNGKAHKAPYLYSFVEA